MGFSKYETIIYCIAPSWLEIFVCSYSQGGASLALGYLV